MAKPMRTVIISILRRAVEVVVIPLFLFAKTSMETTRKRIHPQKIVYNHYLNFYWRYWGCYREKKRIFLPTANKYKASERALQMNNLFDRKWNLFMPLFIYPCIYLLIVPYLLPAKDWIHDCNNSQIMYYVKISIKTTITYLALFTSMFLCILWPLLLLKIEFVSLFIYQLYPL
jgi:hypothetical protein